MWKIIQSLFHVLQERLLAPSLQTELYSEIFKKSLNVKLIQNIFEKIPINELNTEQKKDLFRYARIFSYQKDQVIFVSGEMSDYVPYLLSGSISIEADDGKLNAFDYKDQSSRYPLVSMNPFHFTAIATISRTHVLWVKRDFIKEYLDLSKYEVEENSISSDDWSSLSDTSQNVLENRKKLPPVPSRISDYLNELQLATVDKLEGFGWEIFFIRRKKDKEVIVMMRFPSSGRTALVEKDGSVDLSHKVATRSGKSS
jgi:CRP-like cAMP-binding protein